MKLFHLILFAHLWMTTEGYGDILQALYDHLKLSTTSSTHLTKPVAPNNTLVIRFGLTLISLIDIDELEQSMTTNVWVYQEWEDRGLSWDPANFENVTKIDVPSHLVWIPDIVLYNSADGTYAMPLKLRVTISYNGTIRWEPPVIWKSACKIDIQYFPFDKQSCEMKFGSWSYDGSQIDLVHRSQINFFGPKQLIENAIDSESNYRPSVEWNLISLPAIRSVMKYTCCPDPYIDVTFFVKIERKALFYTINVIFPILIISCLSVFVFYLPAESGEKMSLSVSILVSLIMFFLVLFEKIPATSFVIPLMAKFLLFAMILVTLSVVLNVVVIRVHWQALYYREMPSWIRSLFLVNLSQMLLSATEKKETENLMRKTKHLYDVFGNIQEPPIMSTKNYKLLSAQVPLSVEEEELVGDFTTHVNTITRCLSQRFLFRSCQNEWRIVAIIIDRIFLYIFTAAFTLGSATILLSGVLQTYAVTNRLN